MKLRVSIAASIVVLLIAMRLDDAQAQDIDPDAKIHRDLAVEASKTKDWETAIREFEIAYSIDAQDGLLFGWAQAERFNGNCRRAIELYEMYLETEPDEDWADGTKTLIGECREQLVLDGNDEEPEFTESTSDDGPKFFTHPLAIVGLIGLGIGGTVVVLGELKISGARDEQQREDFVDGLEQGTFIRRAGWTMVVLGVAAVATRYFLWRKGNKETAISAAVTDEQAMVFWIGRF